MKNHTDNRHIELLSELMFHGDAEDFSSLQTDLQGLPIERLQFNAEEFQQLLKLADTHHVTVRAFRVLGDVAHAASNAQLEEWCEAARESRTQLSG